VLGEQGLKLLGGTTMFLGEEMCSKFNLIVMFSNEFELKLFQLQNFNSPPNLSHDRSQAHIKMNMRWL
jgi:hypothetical protein